MKGFNIIVALVIVIGGWLGYSSIYKPYVEKQQLQQASAFVADSIKAITGTWNSDELQKRAHPLLLESIQKAGQPLSNYFAALQKLGNMSGDTQCTLAALSRTIAPARYSSAEFSCNAQYANGPATILITARQDDKSGPWQIIIFRVESPVFSAAAAPSAPSPAEKSQETAPEKAPEQAAETPAPAPERPRARPHRMAKKEPSQSPPPGYVPSPAAVPAPAPAARPAPAPAQ